MPTWGVAPFDPPLKQNVVHDLLASSNWLDQFFACQYSRQTNFPTLQSLSSLALPILAAEPSLKRTTSRIFVLTRNKIGSICAPQWSQMVKPILG
jgi:hypothetical protein